MIKETEELDLYSHPVRHAVEVTIPQRNVFLEQTKRTDRLRRPEGQNQSQQNNAQNNSDGNVQAAAQALN